jgi:hypothetical protein
MVKIYKKSDYFTAIIIIIRINVATIHGEDLEFVMVVFSLSSTNIHPVDAGLRKGSCCCLN